MRRSRSDDVRETHMPRSARSLCRRRIGQWHAPRADRSVARSPLAAANGAVYWNRALPRCSSRPRPAARTGKLPRCAMSALLVGYARCSTDQQDLTAQRDALLAMGVEPERIYVDHGPTGTNRERPGLREALAACRAGDTLVVTTRPSGPVPARRPSNRRRTHHPADQPLTRRVGLRPHRRRRSPAVQRPSDGRRVRV